MTRPEFHRLLETEIGLSPGTIQGQELLKDIPKWDSLAVLSFIALVDTQFRTQVSVDDITACKSIADLERLLAAHLST